MGNNQRKQEFKYYAVFKLRFDGIWATVGGAGYFDSPDILNNPKAINNFISVIAKSVNVKPKDVLFYYSTGRK